MPAAAALKVLVSGRAAGPILRSRMPINFLGSVDKQTGVIGDRSHDLCGKSIKDVVLAFPSGAGSSVGAYTIHAIKSGGAAPRAMICQRPDLTVATGCAVAGIPLVIMADDDAFESLQTGMHATIDTGRPDAVVVVDAGQGG